MAQEFTIKSESIESKINQLLPSQGGQGAGIDFSASTMVIPIVDLTETAEGSQLRSDLQLALSIDKCTEFVVNNTTSTLVNTAGYFRIVGTSVIETSAASNISTEINLSDGFSNANVWGARALASTDGQYIIQDFDLIVFLNSGDTLSAQASSSAVIKGSTRQVADISGNLVNP